MCRDTYEYSRRLDLHSDIQPTSWNRSRWVMVMVCSCSRCHLLKVVPLVLITVRTEKLRRQGFVQLSHLGSSTAKMSIPVMDKLYGILFLLGQLKLTVYVVQKVSLWSSETWTHATSLRSSGLQAFSQVQVWNHKCWADSFCTVIIARAQFWNSSCSVPASEKSQGVGFCSTTRWPQLWLPFF